MDKEWFGLLFSGKNCLSEIEAIEDKVLANKSGWYDKRSFEHFDLTLNYRLLVGDAGGPKGA